MKFMLMMQSTPAGFEGYAAWHKDARIVEAGSDLEPLVNDGPFAETKEFLAGFWIVECESLDRACHLAARISAAPGVDGEPLRFPIEVRQVMEGASEEAS